VYRLYAAVCAIIAAEQSGGAEAIAAAAQGADLAGTAAVGLCTLIQVGP
jgi:hypothetical protein